MEINLLLNKLVTLFLNGTQYNIMPIMVMNSNSSMEPTMDYSMENDGIFTHIMTMDKNTMMNLTNDYDESK